jgi:hypothetical protein
MHTYLTSMKGGGRGNQLATGNWEGNKHTCTITTKEHSWVRRGIPWDVDDLFTIGLGIRWAEVND